MKRFTIILSVLLGVAVGFAAESKPNILFIFRMIILSRPSAPMIRGWAPSSASTSSPQTLTGLLHKGRSLRAVFVATRSVRPAAPPC